MSMFSNLTTTGLEEAEDRLGGYQPLDTDIYKSTVKAAYAGKAASGALNVTVILDTGSQEYRETIYVTTKDGNNYFLNKNDNTKKVPLPGFTIIDDLCLVTTNKPLANQTMEEKVMNIYDPEQKKEVPKSVQMLTELIGKSVHVAITRILENKQEKNSAGEYVAIADTRETNTINKIFHDPTKLTVVEAKNQNTEPVFYDSWIKRHKGNVHDRRTIKEGGSANGGQSGRPSGPPQSGTSTSRPQTSLFGS